MPEEPRPEDPRHIWKQQPAEDTPVFVEHVLTRRTRQLHVSTRAEIIMTMLAAVFFIAVLTWRLPFAGFPLQPAGLAVAAVWIVITAFYFRRILWGPDSGLDTAAAGTAYYRRELEIRRDHLRNAWLWHGPLLLALLLFAVTFAGSAFPGVLRFRNAAPLILILVLWIAIGIRRRFGQAADIQREIDEIRRLEERP